MDNKEESEITPFDILHLYAKEKTETAKRRGMRFVHYTSAEAAMGILHSQQMWMRNCRTMNDASEIEYGIGCLLETWNGSGCGHRLQRLLNQLKPTLAEEITRQLNHWRPSLLTDTYIACVSEHENDEDTTG